MQHEFHLSLGVHSLEDSVNFFENLLMARVVHRDPSGYVNIDFYGCQLTLKHHPDIQLALPDFHFGVNLQLPEFDRLARRIHESGYAGTVTQPKLIDAQTPRERKKMYVKCPTGYLIEIKGYPER